MKTSRWKINWRNGVARHLILTMALLSMLLGNVRQAQAQLVWNTLICSNSWADATKTAQFEYFFTNTSPRAVRVSRVLLNCSEIIVEQPTDAVEPLAVGRIALKVDVEREEGLIQKTVQVFTDDPKSNVTTLTAIAKIPNLVVFSPQSLHFFRTNLTPKVVTFSNILDGPIRIQSVTYGCDTVTTVPIRAIAESKTPGREVRLRITPSPAEEPYTINFVVVVQQWNSGVEKNYRFKATIR